MIFGLSKEEKRRRISDQMKRQFERSKPHRFFVIFPRRLVTGEWAFLQWVIRFRDYHKEEWYDQYHRKYVIFETPYYVFYGWKYKRI